MKKTVSSAEVSVSKKAKVKSDNISLGPAQSLPEKDALNFMHKMQMDKVETELKIEELKKQRDRAEEAAKKYSGLYSEIYDFTPVSYFSFTREGKILDLNLKASELLGIDRSDLINKNFVLFLSGDTRSVFKEFLSQVFNELDKTSQEVHILRQDKSLIYALIEGKLSGNDKCLAMVVDIADRRKSEAELRIREERFRSLSETMMEGVEYRDSEGKIISINPAGLAILGREQHELLGEKSYTPGYETVKEDGTLFPESEHPWNIALKTGLPTTGNIMKIYNPRVKSFHWIRIDSIPLIRKGENQPYQVYCMFEDITDRKNDEKELLKREELFKSAFEKSVIAMALTSMNGELLRINSAFCNLTGYNEKELRGIHFKELTHPDDLEENLKGMNKLYSGEIASFRMEKRYIRKDGQTIWVDMSTAPVRNEKGEMDFFVTHVQDISKRKRAEVRLRESKEKFKQLANSIPQHSFIARSDGYIIWFNKRWYQYTGAIPGEALGWGWRKYIPEPLTLEKGRAFVAKGKPFEMVIPLLGKDGLKREFLMKTIPFKDKNGRVEQWFGTLTDISELKKVERELKNSKEKLSIALENGNIGTWEWNLKTNEFYWDERTEKMFDLKPGKFEGTYSSFLNSVHEEDLPHLEKALRQTVEDNQPFETILRTKPNNGESGYISLKAVVTKDREGNPVYMEGVCFDVTGLKKGSEQILVKMNEELLRSNMDLQQFAYVASHDLQEPLRMVSSFTQLLQKRYYDKLDMEANEYINFAVDGSKRMYDLLNGLLTFSRIQTRGQEFSKVNMNNMLQKAKENLKLVIEETKAVITNTNLPEILGDESQMIQVLQNLIENGIKFSNGIPRITISSEKRTNEYIFSIRDEGIGIESIYFERIFRIFQKLHSAGEYKGTGIGLAICKRIIERHGGKIWVESKQGEGSAFYFSVPLMTK